MPIKVPRIFLLFAIIIVGGIKVLEREVALPAELRPMCVKCYGLQASPVSMTVFL